MSNILIIKHGSLGDLIQANGAIQDIKNTYKTSKEFKEDVNLAEIMAIIDLSWYDSSNSITMQRVRKFADKMMQNYNN